WHQAMAAGEVIDREERELCHFGRRQAEEGEPQGRRRVGEHTVQKGQAVSEGEAAPAEHEGDVLQVATRPSAIAGQLVHECWRGFLEASAERRFEPDLEATTAHVGRLDEVV